MIRALWYLLRILVFVGIAALLATQEGTVEANWNGYTVQIHLGFAALALFIVLLGVSFLSGLVTKIGYVPREFQRYRLDRRRIKGQQALMRSLSSFASGDYKMAFYFASRAQKFLPDSEAGLPLLLQANAARGKGDPAETDAAFQQLLKNPDTLLLGVQGLMQKAMTSGDYPQALALAREAYKRESGNHYLLRQIYDLEIRNRFWNDALVTLDKAQRKKVVQEADADLDRTSLYLLLGDMAKREGRAGEAQAFYKKAWKIDHNFAPAVVRLAENWLAEGRRVKALGIVQDAWKKTGHPELLPVFGALAPTDEKSLRHGGKYRWFEWVQEFHPESREAVLALARAAIDEELWGEARSALARAEKLGPTKDLYMLWVMMEEKTAGGADKVRQWLDRAAKAEEGPMWICAKTLRRFAVWTALVEPEGYFNTLRWNEIPKAEETVSSSLWLKAS
jgi:HemY protein